MNSDKIKPKFPRILRYTFTGAAIIILTVVLLSAVIAFFYEDEIKKVVVTEVNSHLTVPVTVKEIHFSILKSFPYCSVVFNEIAAANTVNGKPDTLFYFDKLKLKIHLLNALRSDIVIRKAEMSNGFVRMKINKDGTDNFHFWKNNNESSSTTAVNLKEILLKDIEYRYADESEQLLVEMDFNESKLSGKFAEEHFALTTEGEVFVHKIISGNDEVLGNRKAVIAVTAEVNTSKGSYTISSGKIKMDDLVFDVTGNTQQQNEGAFYDFKITTNETKLRELTALLPDDYKKQFENFKYVGKGKVTAQVSGIKNKNKITAEIKITDGKISHKQNIQSLENVNTSAVYSLVREGAKSSTSLSVTKFNAMLAGKPVTADFRIDDLSNPYLSLNANADVDLQTLRQFVSIDTLESLSGNARISISYAGKISDAQHAKTSLNKSIKASGTLVVTNMNFTLKKNPLQFTCINGNFVFNDNSISAEHFSGKISGTDFNMQGKVQNFIPFLFLEGQPAAIEASLKSDFVNLDELLERNHASNDTTYKLRFSKGLSCDVSVNIGGMQFRKFKSQNITGTFHLRDQVLSSDALNFSSMKGTVNLKGDINATRSDSILISCSAKIKGLDVRELFYEMENFQQNTLTDKNLRGRTDVDLQFASRWSSDLTINPARVVVDGNIKIFNGELIDFSPVLSLSRFVKLSELQHIRFSTMENNIQIHDRKIFIPSMEIKSSALNLTASGTHTFNNMVDYSVKLLLSDVLGKKVKEQNSEFGIVEDDGLGKSSLFLRMSGPADNPKFAYDKKAVMKKIQTDIASEKQSLKDIFKKEFGSGTHKKDSTSVKKAESKEAVQVDWDDNP
jgi:hypothetical protein